MFVWRTKLSQVDELIRTAGGNYKWTMLNAELFDDEIELQLNINSCNSILQWNVHRARVVIRHVSSAGA